MKTYKIKNPEWRDHSNSDYEHFSFDSIFGDFKVQRKWHLDEYNEESMELISRSKEYFWTYCFCEYFDEGSYDCESIEDGKQKAEEFYFRRLILALEEV